MPTYELHVRMSVNKIAGILAESGFQKMYTKKYMYIVRVSHKS